MESCPGLQCLQAATRGHYVRYNGLTLAKPIQPGTPGKEGKVLQKGRSALFRSMHRFPVPNRLWAAPFVLLGNYLLIFPEKPTEVRPQRNLWFVGRSLDLIGKTEGRTCPRHLPSTPGFGILFCQ